MCEGEVPLTPIIKWFFDKKFDNPNTYCQCVQITMTDHWEVEQFQLILNTLIAHHDALRLCCDMQNQRVYFPQNSEVSVEVTPFSIHETDINSKNSILRKHQGELVESINIQEGRLVQSAYFDFGESLFTWMIVIHHLAVDVVSWHILIGDIQNLMRQIKEDKSPVLQLPEKTHSYQYWAEYANAEADNYNNELIYWNKILEKQPESVMNKFDSTWTDKFVVTSETVDDETTNMLLNQANSVYNTKTEELLIAALTLAMSERFSNNYFFVEMERHGRRGIEDIL